MADDKKISELNELASGNVADTDEFEVVDKSDTTDAASGTNKRFTWSSFKTAIQTALVSAGFLKSTDIDTLAELNAIVGDATLDDSGDARTPTAHSLGGAEHNADTLANLNSKVSDATLDDSGDARTPTSHDNTKHSTNYVGEAGVIAALTGKATPVDADVIPIEDSAASNALKKLTWANLKSVIATAFKDGGSNEIDAAEFGSGASGDGQVLTSDGAGGAAWEDAGGGITITTGHYPLPASNEIVNITTRQLATNTTAIVGLIYLPGEMTVDKITFNVSAVGTAGTLDIAIFSADGQTQEVSETTSSISVGGQVTHTFSSPPTLSQGFYYLYVAPNSTADITVRSWAAAGAFLNPSGEEVLYGTLTVTADTVPATFDPVKDITGAGNATLFCRFDT